MVTRLARWLDSLPRASVRIGDRAVAVYRCFSLLGVALAGGTFALLCAATGASLLVMAGVVGAVALAVQLGALVRRAVLGAARWVLLEDLLVGGAAALGLLLATGRDPRPYLDVLATGAAAGFAAGRVGCFLRGCCYGLPSRFGVLYPPECQPGPAAARRLPVQLVEALVWSLLSACGWLLALTAAPGSAAVAIAAGYGVARLALEGLRGDPRPRLLGLSESRWLALVLLLAAGLLQHGRPPAPVASIGLAALGLWLAAVWLWSRTAGATGAVAPAAVRALHGFAAGLGPRLAMDGPIHLAEVGELRLGAGLTRAPGGPVLTLSVQGGRRPLSAGEAEIALGAVLVGLGLPDDVAGLRRTPGGLFAVSAPGWPAAAAAPRAAVEGRLRDSTGIPAAGPLPPPDNGHDRPPGGQEDRA